MQVNHLEYRNDPKCTDIIQENLDNPVMIRSFIYEQFLWYDKYAWKAFELLEKNDQLLLTPSLGQVQEKLQSQVSSLSLRFNYNYLIVVMMLIIIIIMTMIIPTIMWMTIDLYNEW